MATFCKSFVTASLCGATEPSMPSMGRRSDNFLWLAWKQLYFICPCVSLFLWVYSVCTQKYQTLLASASPAAQIFTSWAHHCQPVCSSLQLRGLSLSLFFLLFFSVSHSPTLSYLFMFSPLTPPPSQVSFHGLACHSPHSLKCLNHLLAALQLWPSSGESVCVSACMCLVLLLGFFLFWEGGFYINMYKHTLHFLLQHLHVNMAQILKQKLTFYRINKSRSL